MSMKMHRNDTDSGKWPHHQYARRRYEKSDAAGDKKLIINFMWPN